MGERVTIKGPDGSFSAYVASAGKAAPAVVVIQEIFGVNEVMRKTCDWLAGEGYHAICPDLFWRIEPGIDITDKTQAEWDRAFELFKAFNVDTGITDIKASIAHLRDGGHAKVGAVGYCLGGLMAYLTAARTDVDAAVSYYGVGIDNYLGEASNVSKPLLLHVAEEDGFVSKESQAKMAEGLKGPHFTMRTYPGRDHAFARQGGEHYHEADAKLANERTLDFFRTYLK